MTASVWRKRLALASTLLWLPLAAGAQDETPPPEPASEEQPAPDGAEPATEPTTDAPESTEAAATEPAATEPAAEPAPAAAAAPAPAPELKVLSDTSDTDRGSTRLDEVVVTANKRQQFLQDVPMSITAIRGKDLEKMGAKSFIDYAQTVPALNFGYYGEGRARVNIRGLQAPTGVATVAYLVDGVAQGESPPDAELFDIDRIEVLRGPQGTLYGEGAMGGAIKILTNSANPHTSLSKVLGSYSVNAAGAPQHDLNGMVNVPLIDSHLGLRMVGFQRHSDGYITVREPDHDNPDGFRDYSSENVIKSNANHNDVHGGRLSLDWKALKDLTVTTKYSTQKSNAGYGPAESPELEKRYGEYNVTRGYNPLVGDFTRHDYRQGSVNVNWEMPFASLESVTGYADVKEDLLTGVFVEIDQNLAAQIAGLTLPPGIPQADGLAGMIDFRLINQWSYLLQEFRLASIPGEFFTFDGDFTWTLGFFNKVQSRQAFAELRDDGTFAGALDDDINLHFDTTEYAVYGQGEYAFTPKFSLLLGGRYYRAELVQTALGQGTDGSIYEFTYDDVSPKVTLSYHFSDDILFYTTAAKGFRAGGANFHTISPPPDDIPPTYDPDVLWSYEIGMNSVLFDGIMTVNTAAFMADWTNMQQDIRAENALGQSERVVLNAGNATSEGVELDTTTLLPWGFSLNAGGAYITAVMGEDIPNPNIDGGFIPQGTPLENQPRKSASAGLSHTAPFTGWALTSSLLWSYRGQTHADILNHKLAVSQPYQLWNVQFGLKGAQDVWSADVFMKNVFNKRASSFTFPHLDTDLPMAWRTIGLRLNYAF
jgi:iron complex outermembrane receptor protein